jgi:hypothetical protein
LSGTITQVTVPFEAPEHYSTHAYGCPVVKGERFSVRLSDGSTISP